MDMLENILSQEIVHKLGWTLLHSLWQGGVVVLLLVVCLRVLRRSSANLRYVVSCLGLAVIVLLPVVTFFVIPASAPISDVESIPGSHATVAGQLPELYEADMPLQRAAEYMRISRTISLKQRAMDYYTSALPYIVFSWFIGVLALSLWHFGGFVRLLRLKQQKVSHVDESLKGRLLSLAERLKVTRPVMLMESALVQIPIVVGWFRPVILLPVSALAGLSPEQIEALLAHELAHIRRYDYLVNMIQTLIEILGFYHPAVWWISYTIRVERENCCDDLAVSVCGDKVGYARALTSMEETRLSQSELAVAASGGSLSRRIRRLIGTGSVENIRFGYVPVVISILLIVVLMIPTTLALTAKRENTDLNPDSTAESESINATDAYVAVKDQMNDYERDPMADLDETAAKAQILFDCEIYEVPVGVKFLKGKQKEDESGQMIWLGNEYANRLETLFKKTQKAKKLTAPRVLVLEGEEASMVVGSDIPYNAGYESTTETEPKPIIKAAFEGIELKIKGQVIDSNAIRTEFRLTQSKTSLKTHKDDQGREIQIPVVASSTCATDVVIPGNTPVVIGGLKSQSNDNSQLLLVIIPTIMHPVKGIERKVQTDQRLLEQDKTILQYKALEEQDVELQQMLHEIQTKLAELETRKAELSEVNKLGSVLASPKEPKSDKRPRYVETRKGDSFDVPGEVLDDESIEAEKAIIQAQINALEARLIELRKNYEAEIFNRQSEWWAEMRAFTADVVAAKKGVFDANSVLETDLAALKKIEMEIKNFKQENGENIATDNALYNKLKTMTANRDALQEQIKRDRAVLDRCEKEFKDAQYRREAYMQYRPMAGTDPNEAQRVINLAKRALELQLYHSKGLSSEHTSLKEPRTEHERLAAMADKFAERGDFARAIGHLEEAIELARIQKDYGIGIAIEKVEGLIRIGQVLPNAPASVSSFGRGDIIKAIDGVSTESMSLNEVVARIRGPKDTKVTLTVKSHSQDITTEETFTRRLPLKGSPVLQEYYWRLDAYEAGKTWPQYREMMKDYQPLPEEAVRIFELKYANPEELAQLLNRILESRSKGIKDKPKEIVEIIPDPGHKKLIIHASPDDIRLIQALIAELDIDRKQPDVIIKAEPSTQPKQDDPTESIITQVIKLKYADCESVAQILQQLISDKQLKIVPDKRTNMLLVAGIKSAIEEIKSLVVEIDVRIPDKNLEFGESEM